MTEAIEKPRYRGPAFTADSQTPWANVPVASNGDVAWRTGDNFQNFAARIGVGTGNQNSASGYGFNFITRNRTMLEAAYRGSWIVGAAVDIPADDMTRAGIELVGLEPDEDELMTAAIRDMGLAHQMANVIRWARLFGGAIGYLMIDGQKPDTPLNLDSISEGQFKGLQVFDRTVINPALAPADVVTDMGPSIGMPKFYRTFADGTAIMNLNMHHSRCLRQVGVEMPYYQSRIETFWGESIVERIWDRLVGFDSTTQGVIQLVYKAHLRTVQIEGLRNNIAAGGAMATGMAKMFDFMRQTQSAEGLTLLDAQDKFEVSAYNFAGLDDVLEQMAGQLCGALDIPYSRMFGQTPGGLAATGEGDMRNYDAANARKQETVLRRPWTVLLDVLHRSVLGRPAEPGFTFKFRPLYLPNDEEKAQIGKTIGASVTETFVAGITSQRIALQELRAGRDASGMYGSITDEDIDDAEDTVPEPAPPVDPNSVDPTDEQGGKITGGGGATPIRAKAA